VLYILFFYRIGTVQHAKWNWEGFSFFPFSIIPPMQHIYAVWHSSTVDCDGRAK